MPRKPRGPVAGFLPSRCRHGCLLPTRVPHYLHVLKQGPRGLQLLPEVGGKLREQVRKCLSCLHLLYSAFPPTPSSLRVHMVQTNYLPASNQLSLTPSG